MHVQEVILKDSKKRYMLLNREGLPVKISKVS